MLPLQGLTARFDAMLELVTQVISSFALLISALAILVIVSSVHSLEAREKHKNSIVMSFGFSRRTCPALSIIEWLLSATIAAAGAIIATYVARLLIYQAQFSLNDQPDAL